MEDAISDDLASGMARVDRIPAVLVSKRSRARKQITVRLEATTSDKSDVPLTRAERGNAQPLRHLSLDAVLECAQQLEAELIKKENAKGRGNFKAALYIVGDGARSELSLGPDLWDQRRHRRIETEAEWAKCIDVWDVIRNQAEV
jgi:hypothetical protein